MDFLHYFKSFPVFIGILFATFLIAYLFNRFANRIVKNSTLQIHNDPTNYKFLKHAILAVIYVIGFGLAFFQFDQLETIAKSLLAGAGILAVAVGFASQQALSNIISGIMIIIFRPFRVNDRLKIKDNLSGTVEDITLRHTVIRDFENRRIIVPNDVISKEIIINADFGDDKICKWIEITINHKNDVQKAMNIMHTIIMEHPLLQDNRTEEDINNGKPQVDIKLVDILDNGLKIRAWAWASDTNEAAIIRWECLLKIKNEFDKEQITFPETNIIYIKK